ncbi:MAG: hypothetical protein WBI00_09725, partial [Thermoanaerobaculia bacterium]
MKEALEDALEISRQIPGGVEAVFRRFVQALLHDPPEVKREARLQPGESLGLLPDDGGESLRSAVSLKCSLPGRHLVEDDSQGELVRA